MKNAMKKLATAEHLVNNTCWNNFNISKFTIMKQCSNTLELIRLEEILIHLNKPYFYVKRKNSITF